MALREIRLEQDPILRKKSRPVKNINDRINTLLDDMTETMIEKNGVGLAAVQVGVLRRIVVIQEEEDGEILELINPEIINSNGEVIGIEGCLSVPGESGYVKRPEEVKVKSLNRHGEEIIIEATERLAVILCHEIDHLDGVLYVDKLEDIEDDEDFDTIEDEENVVNVE